MHKRGITIGLLIAAVFAAGTGAAVAGVSDGNYRAEGVPAGEVKVGFVYAKPDASHDPSQKTSRLKKPEDETPPEGNEPLPD